jgi:hypothetical protein
VKKEKEEIGLEFFERNALLLALHILTSAALVYLVYVYIEEVNPLGFVIGVPAAIVSFQTLWIMLNPYAIIFENKIEIKRSMFSNKVWYLIDIKKVSEVKNRGFSITYNDDDVEVINIMGIRPSQLQKFRDAFNHHVCKSLVERDD